MSLKGLEMDEMLTLVGWKVVWMLEQESVTS